MNGFEMSLPTHICYGEGRSGAIGPLLKQLGPRVLIHYGSNRIGEDGLLANIETQLWKEGIQFSHLGGVRSNPTVELVRQGIQQCRERKITGILAIGGGSVMDSAKAIALGVYGEPDIWEIYQGFSLPPTIALPVGVIVTNPASGSESNGVSVLSNDRYHAKRALNVYLSKPIFAILDPTLTVSLTPRQTAISAVDIFSHAFERYFDLRYESRIRAALCESVMKTVVEMTPLLIEKPHDLKLRGELLWCGTIAHNDMIGVGGDFACHGMAHGLTVGYNIPHGEALGMIMPAWARILCEKHPDIFDRFARAVWGETTGLDGVQQLEAFLQRIGMPLTLRERGIVSIDIDRLLTLVFSSGKREMGGGLELITAETVCEIFRMVV